MLYTLNILVLHINYSSIKLARKKYRETGPTDINRVMADPDWGGYK